MIRIFLYVAALLVLAFVAVWVAERPGHVVIPWEGAEYEVAVGALLFAILALAVLLNVVFSLVRLVLRIPSGIGTWRHNSRIRKGHKALTYGMVAIAAGDGIEAHRHAKRAASFLKDDPLSLLLSAEAAQITGDVKAAADHFTTMLETPETEFLGVRGLLLQALARGDEAEALILTQRAAALQPQTPWVLRALFDLQIRQKQWTEALGTLHVAAREHSFPEAERNRRKALLLLLRAEERIDAGGDSESVREDLQKAHHLAPSVPRITRRLAEIKVKQGKSKHALKILEKAWQDTPHRELVDIYMEAQAKTTGLFSSKPKENTPENRLKHAEHLKRLNPNHAESDFTLAKLAIEAGAYEKAHDVLDHIVTEQPATARLYKLMARLARDGDNNSDAAQRWLEGASEIGGPIQVCRHCGTVSEMWTPVCPHCGAFDSFHEETPSPRMPTPLSADALTFAEDAGFEEVTGQNQALENPDDLTGAALMDKEVLPNEDEKTGTESQKKKQNNHEAQSPRSDLPVTIKPETGAEAEPDLPKDPLPSPSTASQDAPTDRDPYFNTQALTEGNQATSPPEQENVKPKEDLAEKTTEAPLNEDALKAKAEEDRIQKALSSAEAAEKAARFGVADMTPPPDKKK